MRASFYICIQGMHYNFENAFFGKHFAHDICVNVIPGTGHKTIYCRHCRAIVTIFNNQCLKSEKVFENLEKSNQIKFKEGEGRGYVTTHILVRGVPPKPSDPKKQFSIP